MNKLWLLSIVLTLALGCASSPKPTTELASTEGAIRAAEEMGANGEPQASLYLRFARENREAATELMKQDENDRAKMRLLMAEADAELALAMAKTKQSADAAKQVVNETKELQHELNTTPTPGSTP